MKKLIFVMIIALILFPIFTYAEETNVDSPDLVITDNALQILKGMKKVAIFLNGNDPMLIRLAEDMLSINMLKKGYDAVNREILEKVIGEQVALKKKSGEDETINALIIGKEVGADAVITGSIILDYNEGVGTLTTKLSSFQLIDVNGKTLISVLFEFPKGKPFSEISKELAEIIHDKSK